MKISVIDFALFTDVTQKPNLVGEHPSVHAMAGGSVVHCLSGASLHNLAFLFLFWQCKKKAPGREVRREAPFGSRPDSTYGIPAGGFSRCEIGTGIFFLIKKKEKIKAP